MSHYTTSDYLLKKVLAKLAAGEDWADDRATVISQLRELADHMYNSGEMPKYPLED